MYVADSRRSTLTFTTHWAYSAEDKLVIFFRIFARKQDLIFHANYLQLPIGENLHDCQILLSGEKIRKKINMSSTENFTESAKRYSISFYMRLIMLTMSGEFTLADDILNYFTDNYLFFFFLFLFFFFFPKPQDLIRHANCLLRIQIA